MTAIATETGAAVLELLDKERTVINMTGLVALLPDHDQGEIKRLTNDLYMQGKIQRVQIMGPRGTYYGFFSLFVQTTKGYRPPPDQVDEAPVPAALPAVLTTEQAVDVLGRAGWHPEAEVVEPIAPAAPVLVERRGPDRRRLTALEVIKRWRLAFPLARVVEIIHSARKGSMSRDDAALAIRMIREHVRGDE
jgi:hypothetical protein